MVPVDWVWGSRVLVPGPSVMYLYRAGSKKASTAAKPGRVGLPRIDFLCCRPTTRELEARRPPCLRQRQTPVV